MRAVPRNTRARPAQFVFARAAGRCRQSIRLLHRGWHWRTDHLEYEALAEQVVRGSRLTRRGWLGYPSGVAVGGSEDRTADRLLRIQCSTAGAIPGSFAPPSAYPSTLCAVVNASGNENYGSCRRLHTPVSSYWSLAAALSQGNVP